MQSFWDDYSMLLIPKIMDYNLSFLDWKVFASHDNYVYDVICRWREADFACCSCG